MSLLQIYQWVCQWKNFENRLTFGEVMGKSLVSCFFLRHSVYTLYMQSINNNCITVLLSSINCTIFIRQTYWDKIKNLCLIQRLQTTLAKSMPCDAHIPPTLSSVSWPVHSKCFYSLAAGHSSFRSSAHSMSLAPSAIVHIAWRQFISWRKVHDPWTGTKGATNSVIRTTAFLARL